MAMRPLSTYSRIALRLLLERDDRPICGHHFPIFASKDPAIRDLKAERASSLRHDPT